MPVQKQFTKEIIFNDDIEITYPEGGGTFTARYLSRKIYLLLFLLIPAVCFASGPYGRISAGYNNTLSIGVGWSVSDNFTVGAEANAWSLLCGVVGGLDARYYFSNWCVKPFADVMIGYGLLGVTYDRQNFYDFAFRAMAGISWRRFDLGAGVTYDNFYQCWPAVTLSYTLPFKAK